MGAYPVCCHVWPVRTFACGEVVMSDPSLSTMTLRLSASPETSAVDLRELEQLGLQLRSELLDLGVAGVDRAATQPAPEGTRGVELIGAVEMAVTALSTGASILQIVEFIRKWRTSNSRRGGLAIEVDGVRLDTSSESSAVQVQQILSGVRQRKGPERTAARKALIVATSQYTDPSLTACGRLAATRRPWPTCSAVQPLETSTSSYLLIQMSVCCAGGYMDSSPTATPTIFSCFTSRAMGSRTPMGSCFWRPPIPTWAR